MSILKFHINKAEEKEIFSHLQEMDAFFVPPLHTYVDIKEYAHKLFTKAVRFEIWLADQLKGLIAGYPNEEKRQYFISNYSISQDLKGLNAAYILLKKVDDYYKENNITLITLEVRKENTKAILFYKRNGFRQVEEREKTIVMDRLIESDFKKID